MNKAQMKVNVQVKSENLAPRVASRLSDRSCSLMMQIDAEDYRITEEKA